jgi:hypothetical protein
MFGVGFLTADRIDHCLILDAVSMIDAVLMYHLLKALPPTLSPRNRAI